MISELNVGYRHCYFTFVPNDVFYIDTIENRIHVKALNITVLPYEDDKTFKIERVRRLKFKYLNSNGEHLQFNKQNLINYIKSNLTDTVLPITVDGLITSDIEDILLIQHNDTQIIEVVPTLTREGLAREYTFNGDFTDTSDNNITGTDDLTPQYFFDDNVNRYVRRFQGQQVAPYDIANMGSVITGTNLTVSCFFKKRSETNEYNFLYSDWSLNQRNFYIFFSNSQLTIMSSNGYAVNGNTITIIKTFNLNQYYHIAVSRENGLVKVFIDGELIHSEQVTYTGQQTSNDITLGQRLIMDIYNYRIYDRALTDEEILTLANE